MEFEDYCKLCKTTFVQYYRCRPMCNLDNENAECGNRIIMPQSALDRLSSLQIEYPMSFEIQNPRTLQFSHCGVLEFVAEEGYIHLPAWLMERLGLKENDHVLMKTASLPKADFIKLQPHSSEFLKILDPKAVLENNFGKFTCLTTGDTITVIEGEKKYYLDVIETRPGDAIRTLETDCEVDFALPLNFKAPVKETASQGEPQQPDRFAGVGRRLDGKTPEQSPAKSSSAPEQHSPSATETVTSSLPSKDENEKTMKMSFTWKKYSLQD